MAIPCGGTETERFDELIAKWDRELAKIVRMPCCPPGDCPIIQVQIFGHSLGLFSRDPQQGRYWRTYREEQLRNNSPGVTPTTYLNLRHVERNARGRATVDYGPYYDWDFVDHPPPAAPAPGLTITTVIPAGTRGWSNGGTRTEIYADEITLADLEAVVEEDFRTYGWETIPSWRVGSGAPQTERVELRWPDELGDGGRPWGVVEYWHNQHNPGTVLNWWRWPPHASVAIPGAMRVFRHLQYFFETGYKDILCYGAGHIRTGQVVMLIRARIKGNGKVCEVVKWPLDEAGTQYEEICREHPDPGGQPNVVYVEPVRLPFPARTGGPIVFTATSLYDFPSVIFSESGTKWRLGQPECSITWGSFRWPVEVG